MTARPVTDSTSSVAVPGSGRVERRTNRSWLTGSFGPPVVQPRDVAAEPFQAPPVPGGNGHLRVEAHPFVLRDAGRSVGVVRVVAGLHAIPQAWPAAGRGAPSFRGAGTDERWRPMPLSLGTAPTNGSRRWRASARASPCPPEAPLRTVSRQPGRRSGTPFSAWSRQKDGRSSICPRLLAGSAERKVSVLGHYAGVTICDGFRVRPCGRDGRRMFRPDLRDVR